MGGGRERIAMVTYFNCAHWDSQQEMIHMHLGQIKDSTNQSHTDLSPLWSLEVPVTSSGGSGVRVQYTLPPGSFG